MTDEPEAITILRENASHWRRQAQHLEQERDRAYAAGRNKEGDALHDRAERARLQAQKAAAELAPFDVPKPAPLPLFDAIEKYLDDPGLWPLDALARYVAKTPGIEEPLAEAEARVAQRTADPARNPIIVNTRRKK